MNIAIDARVLQTQPRTGVGEYTYELLNTLFTLDKTNQYFLFYNCSQDLFDTFPHWEQENVHVVWTRWSNKLLNIFLMLRIVKLDNLILKNIRKNETMKQFNHEVINRLNYFFSPNLNFTSLSKKTKHILTIHDLSFEYFPEYYTIKQRMWHKFLYPKKQCRKANLVLTPSENTKRDVMETYGLSSDKIRVLYPGLVTDIRYQIPDLPAGRQDNKLSEVKKKYNLPDKYILFLGTIEPRKNILGVLEAYQLFQQNCPLSAVSYKLIIAGAPGWKNKDILRALSNTKNVRYIGYVAPEDKSAFYRMSSLFVYPSLYEGFGFPILEAMANGVPVITSNRSSLPEITNGAAYLVNPLKVSEILLGMKLIFGSDEFREELIKNGVDQVKKFTWHRAVEDLLKIFETV